MIKYKKQREPLNRKRVILLTAILIAAVAVLAGLMQTSLTLTVFDITSAAVPEEFDGYRIVHISDYHSGRYGGDADDVIRLTAKQKPDIICLTGDIVDGRTQNFDEVEELVAGLTEIAPVYAVFGNNELYEASVSLKMDQIYAKYGVRRIEGEKVTVYSGDCFITLFGIADPGRGDDELDPGVTSLAENHNEDGFGIILYHRANEFDKLTGMGYQLVLSGHLHGGLIRLPFIGGVLSPYDEFFPKYSGGLYENGGVYLVSNRGIGNNHPIPRVYNPPELVLVILHSEG